MKITKRNVRVANQVSKTLEKEKCTVDEVREILSYVISISGKQSTAQISEAISKFDD